MDPSVAGAIIGAVATVAAALIALFGVIWNRRRTSADSDRESVHQPVSSNSTEEAVDTITKSKRQLAELPLDVLPDPAPLPQGSVMSLSRNILFVGRENELKALARNLKAGDTTAIGQGAIAAATGLGGIGKTQLASEFVHRYGQYFAGGVFWLSFADADSIPAEVAACGGARAMELGPDFRKLRRDDQVREVMSAWQSELPRLLVFDNCEEDELLVKWRPPTGGCRVLITSRRESWGQTLGVRTLPLNVLAREESISLLREHRPDLTADDPDLDAIAEELGDLPLALELAGSYLSSYRYAVTPAAYLEELRSHELVQHPSLQKAREISPTSHPQDVARTFALSYERLDSEDPVEHLAVALLARAVSFAAGEPIPRDLLLLTLNVADGEPESALRKEDALRRLTELGLLETKEAGALRMHRLVAAFVRSVANDEGAQPAVEAALTNIVDTIIDEGIPASLIPLLPHLRALADASEERKDKQAGILHYQLGRYLQMVGAYSEAQAYFEYDLAVRENLHGEEHPSTAGGFNNLANVLRNQGKYEEARKLHERALYVREKIYGEEHPSTANSLNNLGITLHEQGKHDEARRYYERALAIYEKIHDEEHPVTDLLRQNLRILDESQKRTRTGYWNKFLGNGHG
jgi:tetratricopeptide (TPR) repeat protein